MAQKIKYLDIYEKEYRAFQLLKKFRYTDLQFLGNCVGLANFQLMNKNQLIKALMLAWRMTLPYNFEEWK